MATNYQRGAALERQAAAFMVLRGWSVIRGAGSHGRADLVALHPAHRPWLVQCKTDLRNMRPDEWAELFDWAIGLNCVPVLVDRSGPRGAPAFHFVLGARPPRSPVAQYLAPVRWGDM